MLKEENVNITIRVVLCYLCMYAIDYDIQSTQ